MLSSVSKLADSLNYNHMPLKSPHSSSSASAPTCLSCEEIIACATHGGIDAGVRERVGGLLSSVSSTTGSSAVPEAIMAAAIEPLARLFRVRRESSTGRGVRAEVDPGVRLAETDEVRRRRVAGTSAVVRVRLVGISTQSINCRGSQGVNVCVGPRTGDKGDGDKPDREKIRRCGEGVDSTSHRCLLLGLGGSFSDAG